MHRTKQKAHNLLEARQFYLASPEGLTDSEMAERLQVSRVSAFRYRRELGAKPVGTARYTLEPTLGDREAAVALLRRLGCVVIDSNDLLEHAAVS